MLRLMSNRYRHRAPKPAPATIATFKGVKGGDVLHLKRAIPVESMPAPEGRHYAGVPMVNIWAIGETPRQAHQALRRTIAELCGEWLDGTMEDRLGKKGVREMNKLRGYVTRPRGWQRPVPGPNYRAIP